MATRLMGREIFDRGNMWSALDAFHLRIAQVLVKGKGLVNWIHTICIGVYAQTAHRRSAWDVFAEPWMQIRCWGNQRHVRAGPDGHLGQGDA